MFWCLLTLMWLIWSLLFAWRLYNIIWFMRFTLRSLVIRCFFAIRQWFRYWFKVNCFYSIIWFFTALILIWFITTLILARMFTWSNNRYFIWFLRSILRCFFWRLLNLIGFLRTTLTLLWNFLFIIWHETYSRWLFHSYNLFTFLFLNRF